MDGGSDGEVLPLQPLLVRAREVDTILAIDAVSRVACSRLMPAQEVLVCRSARQFYQWHRLDRKGAKKQVLRATKSILHRLQRNGQPYSGLNTRSR